MSHSKQERHPAAEGGEAHKEPSMVPSFPFRDYSPCFADDETEVQGSYITCRSSHSKYVSGVLGLIPSSIRLFVLG